MISVAGAAAVAATALAVFIVPVLFVVVDKVASRGRTQAAPPEAQP